MSTFLEALWSATVVLMRALVNRWKLDMLCPPLPSAMARAMSSINSLRQVAHFAKDMVPLYFDSSLCVHFFVSGCSQTAHLPHHACADLVTNPARALLLVLGPFSPSHHLSLSYVGTPWVLLHRHFRANAFEKPSPADPVHPSLPETRPVTLGLIFFVPQPTSRPRESSFQASSMEWDSSRLRVSSCVCLRI